MKQALIRFNKSYLISIPDTFKKLKENIINKIKTPDINIYHKNTLLTNNNFNNLNDDLIILDISLRLKGGVEYIRLTSIVYYCIFSFLFILCLGFFLFIQVAFIINKSNEQFSFYSLKEFTILPENIMINEIVYGSIIFYVFSFLPISILIIKKLHCPSFNIFSSIILTLVCLFIPFIFLFWINKKGNLQNTAMGLLILFIVFGCILNFISINKLTKLELKDSTDSVSDDIKNLVFLSIFIYMILKYLLRNNHIGKKYIFLLILFTFIGILSYYINIITKHIVGINTLCS
jgi:hypothetical protein